MGWVIMLPACACPSATKGSSANTLLPSFLPSFLLLPGGEVMCVLPSSSLRSANRFWSAIDQVCVRRSVIQRTHFCRRRRRKRMWRFSSRGANLGSPPKKVNVLGISVIALAGSIRLQEISSVWWLSDSFCNSARPETDAY